MTKETRRKVLFERLEQKAIDWAFLAALGGIAAMVFPPIRDTVAAYVALPSVVAGVSSELGDLRNEVGQLADDVDSQRIKTLEVVVWASNRSQSLTDQEGPCVRGAECVAYFRGRRTVDGLECRFQGGRPYLVVDDEHVPVMTSGKNEPVNLGLEFQTIPIRYTVPRHVKPGRAGLLVYTFYADCPFTRPGEVVERKTSTISIIIE